MNCRTKLFKNVDRSSLTTDTTYMEKGKGDMVYLNGDLLNFDLFFWEFQKVEWVFPKFEKNIHCVGGLQESRTTFLGFETTKTGRR